jgi:hypothetical protein
MAWERWVLERPACRFRLCRLRRETEIAVLWTAEERRRERRLAAGKV